MTYSSNWFLAARFNFLIAWLNDAEARYSSPAVMPNLSRWFATAASPMEAMQPHWEQSGLPNLNGKRRTPAAQDAFPGLNDFAGLHWFSFDCRIPWLHAKLA